MQMAKTQIIWSFPICIWPKTYRR